MKYSKLYVFFSLFKKIRYSMLLCIFILFASMMSISLSSSAQSIAAGDKHSLFVCNDGKVMACGFNWWGQLGNDSLLSSPIPIQVVGISDVIAIAGGGDHTIALKNDGTVWTWGKNSDGQLGNGTNITYTYVPVQVSGLTGVVGIATGKNHSFALKNDGTVWAWGNNDNGQLGNGNNTDSNVPVQVSGLTDVIAISAGENYSIALKNDGTVWGWGSNSNGQLSNLSSSNLPAQITSITNVVAISGGLMHVLALKSDGTVWAWGDNISGQIGNGGISNSYVYPEQVSNITGVVSIASGMFHSLALKNDGTVWAWGNNVNGQLGNGTNVQDSNIPVQVSGMTGVSFISAGMHHNLALKNDGTLWAWGYNGWGQLGDNSNTNSNIPIQITNLCSISTSLEEVKMDDKLFLFPNPAHGFFTLQTQQGGVFELMDITGRVLNTYTINNSTETIQVNLPTGMYFIREKASGVTQKLIIE
jgi:alpha-tubulin suppressor-like RCC1 family protein